MGLDGAGTSTRYVVGKRPSTGGRGGRFVALAFGVLGLAYLGFVVACIVSRAGVAIGPGWTAKTIHGIYSVDTVDDASAASLLHPGDQLLSVAGDAEAGLYGPALALSRVPYGSSYAVQAKRNGKVFDVSLSMSGSGQSEWRETLPNLLLSFVLCGAAVLMAALRWSNISARIAALSFMVNGLAIASILLIDYPGWGRLASAAAIGLISLHRPWELALTYDFCSRFPISMEETNLARWTRRLFYALAALLWVPFNVPVLAHIVHAHPWPAYSALMPFGPDGEYGSTIVATFSAAVALLGCFALGRNYFKLRTAGLRLRMRWAILSILSSVGTFFVFASLELISRVTGSTTAWRWAMFVDNTAAIVVGLSFIGIAYAVTKYRIFGIRLAIRQGLRYLLAKNVLRAMIFFPFLLLVGRAMASPDKGLRDVLVQSSWPSYSALAAAGLLGLRYQAQIRPWLDRRFFRVALGQEQVLITLVDRLRRVESEEELCLIAGRVLDETLHVDGCHVYLRDRSDSLRVGYSQRLDCAADLREWLNSDGTGFLKTNAAFMLYEVLDGSEEEDTYASESKEYLVIPASALDLHSKLVLVLGPKRSEEPYTRQDHDLLRGIADQMVMMREVLQLKQNVAQERRTRVEVLGHLDTQRIKLLTECPDCGRCYTTAESACTVDGVMLSLTLPTEQLIDGRYLLERRIGRGGMGVVYRARDIQLNRPVAIKMMLGDMFGNSAALSRFTLEARAVAALNHSNIVAVYDFGRLSAGGAYLVMELIDGKSWRKHLTSTCGMDLQLAYPAIRQLCLAVEAAHAGGVIHRDLKPENLVIAELVNHWRVVVLDFGLAKFHTEALPPERNLTASGVVVGTFGYMSPEQRSGGKVGPGTDVYSVAVICAETLTGARPPRFGVSPVWLRSAFGSVSPDHQQIYGVIERALAHNPSQRPSLPEFMDCIPMSAGTNPLPRSIPSSGRNEQDPTKPQDTEVTQSLTVEPGISNTGTPISQPGSDTV
jgi:hypothetical protein